MDVKLLGLSGGLSLSRPENALNDLLLLDQKGSDDSVSDTLGTSRTTICTGNSSLSLLEKAKLMRTNGG